MPETNLLDRIDDFLEGVSSTKAAEAASSAGHVQNQGDSGTSHPSKSTDDGTQEASEGERSSENTSDVKSDVPGQSVDAASEDKMSGGSENPLTTAKATGEDPANETSSADGLIGGDAGKDSEGKDTSHPAKVDFGGKYASVRELIGRGQIKEAAESLIGRTNDFNAAVAALPQPEEKKAEEADPPKTEEAPSEAGDATEKPASEKSEDEVAGEKAAEVAAASLGAKEEADPDGLVVEMAKLAMNGADVYCDFLAGLEDGKKEAQDKSAKARTDARQLHTDVKQAMEDEMMGADMIAQGGEGEAPNGVGEGAGAGDAGGAMPPEAGMGGGGDIIEQVIAALEAAGIDPAELAEIPPEALAEALTGGGEMGGEMGGMPPEAGGEMGGMMPPEAGGMLPEGGEQTAELAPAGPM